MKTKKIPLSIYIHIPFCKKKCLYCDFLSAPACYRERERYVKALLREISCMTAVCHDKYEVISVFFGGGTPSLLSGSQMKRIMSAIRKGYCLSRDAEITVECNPATADLQKLQEYRACGINRLSIGLQSANEKELKLLGRIHTYDQFVDTFLAAREAGFDNINVDIMSALPGQTMESYLDTQKRVLSLDPEHISAYSLIIEEGTPFYAKYGAEAAECVLGQPMLPDEDTERKMYHTTKKILEEAGYKRYEISNYAKKGFECRHNLTYWTGIEYIGFGIGAASYLQGLRFKNIADIGNYMEWFTDEHSGAGARAECFRDLLRSPIHTEIYELSLEDKMEEYMFLGLRLTKGVSVSEFQKKFGVPITEIYGTVIEKLKEERLLRQHADRLALSLKGMDLANYVMAHFMLG